MKTSNINNNKVRLNNPTYNKDNKCLQVLQNASTAILYFVHDVTSSMGAVHHIDEVLHLWYITTLELLYLSILWTPNDSKVS